VFDTGGIAADFEADYQIIESVRRGERDVSLAARPDMLRLITWVARGL
jgi:hypothetical protein